MCTVFVFLSLKQNLFTMAKSRDGNFIPPKGKATGFTSVSPEDVISACFYAKAEIVYVEKDCLLWGTFNEQDNRLTLSEERQNDDACMLNAAVPKALQTGATVFAREKEYMPEALP